MTRHITRRSMLRGSMGAGFAAFLAACGIGPADNETTDEGPVELGDPAGELSIATWPLYIDVDEETDDRPTIDAFEDDTGIEVTYREVIDDNDPFFGTIRASLSRGQSTGWDIIVITDWLVGRMRRLGYLEELDRSRLPLVERNLGDAFEVGGDALWSVPWQAGITGIGYNPELTGRDITSFGDLFDPEFEGKVGMLSDMRDMIHLTLLWMDIDPDDARIADVREAASRLRKQRDDGLVRGYFENDYTDALAKGDLAVCLAYSGDIFQLQADNPDLSFVVPDEGGILWVDEMAIPKGAEHPADAHEWMNFVYDPQIAANIVAYVNFISPNRAAPAALREQAAESSGEDRDFLEQIAKDPLIFPTEEMQGRLHRYRVLGEDDERAWNDLFEPVIEG